MPAPSSPLPPPSHLSPADRQGPPADRGRINIEDPLELRWWCGRLGCTDLRLREAVRAVGVTATRVAQYLRDRRALARG